MKQERPVKGILLELISNSRSVKVNRLVHYTTPLNRLRNRLGLSVTEMALRLGIGRKSLMRYISGDRTTPKYVYVLIANGALNNRTDIDKIKTNLESNQQLFE